MIDDALEMGDPVGEVLLLGEPDLLIPLQIVGMLLLSLTRIKAVVLSACCENMYG
jgi:hypothetical protein